MKDSYKAGRAAAIFKFYPKESQMATRCRIGIQTENSIRHVYCHWEGYPEHILPIITKWDREEFGRLMEKGDLSFLHDTVAETEKQNEFYGNSPAQEVFEEHNFWVTKDGIDYIYLFSKEGNIKYEKREFHNMINENWCLLGCRKRIRYEQVGDVFEKKGVLGYIK